MPEKKRGIQDRAPISTRRISTRQISMSEEQEVRYWTKALGVSREELAEAISKVGNLVRRNTPRVVGTASLPRALDY